MQMHLEPNEAALRDSATVVMLRDGARGLEVFLVQRHGSSEVLGGAFVFPGGKVDAEDRDAALHARLDRSPASLAQALAEPQLAAEEAAAIHVAALRETLEECGVLFAPDASEALARTAASRVRAGERLDDVAASLGLTLAAGALTPWSRWITPVVGGVVRKRFDTRFFLARVPPGQSPVHDEREATASVWLTPGDALRRYWEGEIPLAPPQVMSLAHLARLASVDAAIAEAARRAPPLVLPESFEDEDGVRVMCYPGDVRHSARERALPGPTRLRYVRGRFEPEGGSLAALLQD